jgi:hypothetical protein
MLPVASVRMVGNVRENCTLRSVGAGGGDRPWPPGGRSAMVVPTATVIQRGTERISTGKSARLETKSWMLGRLSVPIRKHCFELPVTHP